MRDPETVTTPLQELQHGVVVKGVESTVNEFTQPLRSLSGNSDAARRSLD